MADVNDNAPTFPVARYSAEILENNYVGASIVQVSAVDADLADNARLVYSLSKDVEPYVEIDRRTGVVRAKTSLDRERTAVHRFKVFAADGGSPSRTGTATVSLVVLDVNDEPPRFVGGGGTLMFDVEENRPPGTEVGRLEARDADSEPFDQFSFRFLYGGSVSDAFAVDRKSGVVTTTRPLDREQQEYYHLVAVVMDDGGGQTTTTQMTSSIHVKVRVTDVNDNAPLFDSSLRSASADSGGIGPESAGSRIWAASAGALGAAPNRTYVIGLSNQVTRSHAVTTIKATDSDAGENATLEFAIVAGNDDRLFVVNGDVIALSRDLHGDVDNEVG